MVDELKVLAEILGNAGDQAIVGVVVYMIIDLLKPVIIVSVLSVLGLKIAQLAFKKPAQTVIEVEKIDAL